jgi:hypothetical protein
VNFFASTKGQFFCIASVESLGLYSLTEALRRLGQAVNYQQARFPVALLNAACVVALSS